MGLLDNLNLGNFDISNVTEKLGAGLGKSSNSVVGVDIGTSAIKVVQLRKEKGAAVLETYGELSLGPYADLEIGRATSLDTDKLAEALRDILKESNITSNNVGVSIPFASSLITLIELPALQQHKLASVIPIEARKYIPVPISEVQLDWFIIPEGETKFLSDNQEEEEKEKQKKKKEEESDDDNDKTLVLLVAIHNEVLEKYNTVLKAANLKPSFYEIEIFSSIRSILTRGIAPVVVLDIGAVRTKLYIVEYGIVRSSHVINKGSQDITLALSGATGALGATVTKAEQLKREFGLLGDASEEGQQTATASMRTMEYIFSEAGRSVTAYQRRHNTNISQIILTGGGSTIKGALPLAEKKFDMEVTLGDPFAKVGSPAFLEEVLKEAGPEFAVAVGLALRKLQEL